MDLDVECGGGEGFVDKVSCVWAFLPLSFSIMESPSFGIEDCVDVPPCRNGI